MIDLSSFKPIEESSTYDSQTFASIGYVQIGNRWCRKDLTKTKAEQPKVSKLFADFASIVLKEAEEIKARMSAL